MDGTRHSDKIKAIESAKPEQKLTHASEKKRKKAPKEIAALHKIGEKHHKAMEAGKEAMHIAEQTGSILHRLHIGILGALHILEELLPPIRLALVGVTSIWEALNAVYFSKKSKLHRGAQVAIAAISTLTVVISLIIPHALLAMLVTYAGAELFREFTHFFEALKDYWKLRKVKHAINQEKLNHIRDFLLEKTGDIAFGAVAVVGAVLTLFSTVALFGTPLPIIGLGLLIASGLGGLLFRGGLWLEKGIRHWWQSRIAKKEAKPEVPERGEVEPVRERPRPGAKPEIREEIIPAPRPEVKLPRQTYPPPAPHESTADIYQTLNLLKEEANQQKLLREAGWTPQRILTDPERKERLDFWESHHFRSYRVPQVEVFGEVEAEEEAASAEGEDRLAPPPHF